MIANIGEDMEYSEFKRSVNTIIDSTTTMEKLKQKTYEGLLSRGQINYQISNTLSAIDDNDALEGCLSHDDSYLAEYFTAEDMQAYEEAKSKSEHARAKLNGRDINDEMWVNIDTLSDQLYHLMLTMGYHCIIDFQTKVKHSIIQRTSTSIGKLTISIGKNSEIGDEPTPYDMYEFEIKKYGYTFPDLKELDLDENRTDDICFSVELLASKEWQTDDICFSVELLASKEWQALEARFPGLRDAFWTAVAISKNIIASKRGLILDDQIENYRNLISALSARIEKAQKAIETCESMKDESPALTVRPEDLVRSEQ